MPEKKLIFGLGTGRCGTHSLRDLLNGQFDSFITHESGDIPLLPWAVDEQKIKQLLSVINKRKYMYVGDVSFYMLPYCEYILKVYPDSKFICLKRGKVDTIKSYCEKTQGRNHWQTHCGTKYKNCEWDKCYPKYSCNSKEEAIGLYYDDYYSTVESLADRYPNSIKILNMQELNTTSGVRSILGFVGIPEEKMVVTTNVRVKAR